MMMVMTMMVMVVMNSIPAWVQREREQQRPAEERGQQRPAEEREQQRPAEEREQQRRSQTGTSTEEQQVRGGGEDNGAVLGPAAGVHQPWRWHEAPRKMLWGGPPHSQDSEGTAQAGPATVNDDPAGSAVAQGGWERFLDPETHQP